MENMELDTEADVFLWETSVETADVDMAEEPDVEELALRNAALEALDALGETAEPDEDVVAANVEALNIDVDAASAEEEVEFSPDLSEAVSMEDESLDLENVETIETIEIFETTFSEVDYIDRCLALFDDKYPEGIDSLFYNGLSQGLFALMGGAGLVSGDAEWTDEDYMLLDAIFIKLEQQGLDLEQIWEDFTTSLVTQLFPDGFDTDQLEAIFNGNGPISGMSEWTDLDFLAVQLATEKVWETEPSDYVQDAIDLFAEAFPDGTTSLFPDGYSDEAFDAIYWGAGLISGQSEWTDADYMAFDGLWQTLAVEGIDPYSDDAYEEYWTLPIDGDDGLAYPMPIVIDDGYYDAMPIVIDDGYYDPMPIVIDDGVAYPMPIVVDDGFASPHVVICRMPPEDMMAI